jgi:spore germination protein YaaH
MLQSAHVRRLVACLVVCALARAEAAPSRRVFGYLYAGAALANVHWDLVTDVAFFSEPLSTSGTLTTTSWSAAGKTMVDTGHQYGVRVMLTVTLFNSAGGSEIATFLGSPTAVASGTQAIVDAVAQNGADGVDLDFEFVPRSARAQFVSFVGGLATALHAAVPGSDVSVATPGDAYPGYDLAGLGAAADTLMIMAYDFHYAGGPPGPVAPLADSTLWGAGSDTASVALYTSLVADPSQLLLGVPLYGYDYYTTSSAVPGTKVAGTTATAVTWKNAETLAPTYGRQWDDASSTPYYVYQDASGQWRQTFYEDSESLGLKIDLVLSSGLGGIGLWELSYASDSFWSLVDAKLAPVADAGADAGGDDAGLLADAGGDDAGADASSRDGAGGDAGSGGRDVAALPHGASSGCGILPHHREEDNPVVLIIGVAAVAAARRSARTQWTGQRSRRIPGRAARP